MKTCRTCNKDKFLTDFYKHSQMSDGYLNHCVDCVKTRIKSHRQLNLEKIREYDRTRGRTEKRKARSRIYSRLNTERSNKYKIKWAQNNPEKAKEVRVNWIKKNPHKRQAQIIVGNAVRDGKLIKQPCEKCGNPKVDAHHYDYSKPLDVQWLCRKHHMQEHRVYKEAA